MLFLYAFSIENLYQHGIINGIINYSHRKGELNLGLQCDVRYFFLLYQFNLFGTRCLVNTRSAIKTHLDNIKVNTEGRPHPKEHCQQ